MADDRRLTISSSSRLHPDEVARHTFGTARRGFDPAEVRLFLEGLAREMERWAEREEELLDAVADAERRAANPVLDEATLTAALGQETAKVLRTAHDAATELLARAEADNARARVHAQEEAAQLHARAEKKATDRMAHAEAAAGDLRRRAEEEWAAKLEASKLEAEALLAQARAECRAMVQEAQEVRARVLADLTRRRRVLHSQIEQLRAGRERLAETIGDVRQTVDRVTDELFRAEDEARLAAEAAGRQAAAQDASSPEAADVVAPQEARRLPPPADGPDGGAPSAPEEIGTGVLEADEATRKQAVDELFARLRAERGPAGLGADPETSDGQRTSGVDRGPEQSPASVTTSPAVTRGATTPDVPPTRAASTPPGPDPAGGDTGDPRLTRRDELLAPVVSTLVRRLKRALQDDQNDILDRVRARGGWSPEILAAADDHERRYTTAAAEPLGDAARSGATFAGGKPDDAPVTDAVAAELAAAIVVPLRRRLDGVGASFDAGDDAAVVEHVGAAFRDWKGARVERLAGDNVLSAFSLAVLAVTPGNAALRWIFDDGGAQCPDCDDNALAGPLLCGERFPTGHANPPAHAGCRCLLAPAEA
jgi:DivIVA domain-containing protein